ncbi:centrosomal protein of 162 kDa [Scomber scombrus]|uniref:centrosomal protein of 162 kDa n=1 Tax=Scomber scombrus TaxID=13677 RepID=UPI002DD97FF5|nr:centrosomal protein of 162 kDa [Scomber scombrus]
MSHRLTKDELDEQFELFLKESVSDDSVDFGGSDKQSGAKSSPKLSRKTTVSWWQDDEHSDGATGRASAPAVTNMGMDTLEEEEEKARFFARLEAGALSTIDYSQLNRELDSTPSTMASNLRKAEESVEQSQDDQRRGRLTETVRDSPVSLYDSLDDTGGEDMRKDTAASVERGQSYVQSGGSEMEALHDAYRQIHVVEDSDDHHSLEGRGRLNRPVSPSSLPHYARQSLQPASTNESELPTAEELMRPIRPETDHTRGFSLQPVRSDSLNNVDVSFVILSDDSAVQLDQDKTFPDVTSPDSHQKRPGRADSVGTKAARGLTSHPSISPDHLNRDLTWSIREEVEKLMRDQTTFAPHTSSQTGKAKKQPASRGSTISNATTSSWRKPSMTAVRGRRVEGRAAVASRSTGLNRAAATAKSQSTVSHSLEQPREKAKPTMSQEKDDSNYTETGQRVSSELVASVQSLVTVLQQQIDISGRQDAAESQEVRSSQETRLTQHLLRKSKEEDSSVVEELRVQLAQKERELERMKQEAEELHSLRQHNYLLQSKLHSAEEANQKRRLTEATDSATEKKLQQIDKEIKEQETLIKGYQQENEKLYLQMKAQQVRSKANEDAMFNENQRLLNELAFTREQLNKSSRPVGNVCSMDHTQRITDLLAQINTFQRNEAKLSEDMHRLKQEKQALEVDMQLMKKERDLAKAQAVYSSGDKTFELRVLEDTHREEVSALKKKLQWFAENQELLDRDAGRLKAATAEIHQLKEQVEKLKTEVGRRSSEQQRKAKDKSMESKRMQDLERQVKELEQILRRRNPNSLPALIYAAATAGSHGDADAARTSPPGRINALLERRVQRLEAELESHDEEAKRSLRAMEQQFHSIKLRYEQQISDLEQQVEQREQLTAAASTCGTEPWVSQVRGLEEELQRVKEVQQQKEKSLQDQIESLQEQLKHKAQPSPGRHQRQAEAATGVRLERLNQELSAKTQTIQELNRTVQRLQRERRNMLSVPNTRHEARSTETKQQPTQTKQQPTQTKTLCPSAAGDETFPAAHYEKTYQPTVFTGSHISEVLQENEALMERLELLELHGEREKEALKSEVKQAEEEVSRLKQQLSEQLSSLKAEHLGVLERLQATHALEHSSSKVAQLTNELNTQEIMVKHLQEQLKELQGVREALTVSRTREDALQKQLSRLLKDLKEAKEAQSPEVRLACSLERKILNMELRHQHREKELQQVIGGSWLTPEAEQQPEVERWKRVAQDKSRELEAFRLELDSILDILKHLQRQGVVLTPPT